MSVINFCKNINFEVNLFNFITVFLTSLLVTAIFLAAKKVVLVFKSERKTDERLRQTRTRISNVLAELKEYDDEIQMEVEVVGATLTATQILEEVTIDFVKKNLTQARTKDDKQCIVHSKPITNEDSNEKVPYVQEIYEVAPSRKKTRAMSMEERWAEYNQKRLMRSTA